jgi:nucleotide-binding universal stress UspA family protein
MYKHILVPTDGSEFSEQAVNYGVALAKSTNANPVLVCRGLRSK